ncbi:MAG: hypothetical protein H6P95_573, partial [Candidatus Aminicenantes bacterium]|nr:hypothetical protein [Candidatus Aminicenantes bacterium]
QELFVKDPGKYAGRTDDPAAVEK